MRTKLPIFILGLVMLTSILLLSGCPESNSTSSSKGMPEFNLENIHGGMVNSSDLKGKVLVLDFWASWCSPCLKATPYLKKLHKEFEGKPVEIIGVNMDYDKSNDFVVKFAKKKGIAYTILKGNQEVVGKFKIRGIPAFFLIDKESNIKMKYIGFNPSFFNKLPSEINKLLEE